MTLPPLLMLTDRSQLPAGRSLLEQVSRSVEAGVRAVILRERDLDDEARGDLASDLAALLDPVGGHVIVAAPEVGPAAGVHLRSDDAFPEKHAPLVGRSCHNAEELRRACAEGVDFVLLGPVAPTASKPGYGPALGPQTLHHLIRDASFEAQISTARPLVYALGGVDERNAADWMRAGADGIAVMGALMRADDPGAVASELIAVTTARSHT